jgi:uncharacterized protein
VFYEMLTGELPLGKFAPPSQKVHIDVRLDEVVLRALEKEPARRYQQVGEVKTDLDTIASSAAAGGRREAAGGRPRVMAPSEPASAWEQVKGPAVGLMVTGILSWVAIPILMVVAALMSDRRRGAALLAVPLAALVVGGTLFLAGLLIKRLTAYWLAVAASLLAILTTPGNLIGLPIGIWALVVLSRREVREAFGQGHRPPLDATASGGGGWKVAAVIVAAIVLVLAIPIAAILLAIGFPAYTRAREHGRMQQQLQQEQLQQERLQEERSRQEAENPLAAPPAPAVDGASVEAVRRGSEAWQQGDYRAAFNALMPAAVRGNPSAQHRLGVMYVQGDGVRQDLAEATRWFRRAADQGQGESQFSMGLRYLEGKAVVQDFAEAARWLKLAAEQGVGMAASRLAQLYVDGQGVPADDVEAYKWLVIAGSEIEPGVVTITLRELRRRMSPDQLAEAERRIRQFVPKRTGPADP